MDAVSYAHSAKQAKRIKRFIENPDSDSGVLTQPMVIEAGETVTIKSGRQAILADTVVDGDLVIEAGGDVFVPAGAGFSDLESQIALKADTRYVDGKYSGFKNYIINGGFDIWQRGTSFTNTTTQGTKLDGNYIASQTPSGTCVLVKDTISYNDTAYNALKATANSINVSSSSFFVFHWALEGLNTYHLQNKELTMSFLIEVSHSGNYNLNIRKYNSSNAIHKTFAKLIPLVAGVNNVVVNIPADSGEIQNSNNRGLSFVIAGDTNSNSTSVEGWQSGDFATINGARRWWETNGAYVKVAQVQLEEGSVATPFENRPYGLELSLCQRYFYAKDPGINITLVKAGGTWQSTSYKFPVTMRVSPSVIISGNYQGDWNGLGSASIQDEYRFSSNNANPGSVGIMTLTASAEL